MAYVGLLIDKIKIKETFTEMIRTGLPLNVTASRNCLIASSFTF